MLRTRLNRLLALNLALQIFDGVATYQGLRVGFSEANPLLMAAIRTIDVAPALLLFKANACGLLVLLYRFTPSDVGVRALRLLALVYCAMSFLPWLGKFFYLAVSVT